MKNKSIIIIISAILVLTISGVVFWVLKSNDDGSIEEANQDVKNINTKEIDVDNEINIETITFDNLSINNLDKSSWKIYDNKEYGFNIKYPTDWKIKNEKIGSPSLRDYEYFKFIKNEYDNENCHYVEVEIFDKQKTDLTLEWLLSAEENNYFRQYFLPRYWFYNNKFIYINNNKFIVSEDMPNRIMMAMIHEDKYFIIRNSDDTEKIVLTDSCREIYYNIISTLKFEE